MPGTTSAPSRCTWKNVRVSSTVRPKREEGRAIRNDGDSAVIDPRTLIVYMPGRRTALRSMGYTAPYLLLHEPALGPTRADRTVVPRRSPTARVAPAADRGAMRYARLVSKTP